MNDPDPAAGRSSAASTEVSPPDRPVNQGARETAPASTGVTDLTPALADGVGKSRRRGASARGLAMGIFPAGAIALIYLTVLGPRPDYVGHLAAGYGGTWGVIVVLLSLCDEDESRRLSPWIVTCSVLACIALGAVAEASVFRLAIWDPVDFANQSLGAVCAGLAALGGYRGKALAATDVGLNVAVAAGFLMVGVYFAMG